MLGGRLGGRLAAAAAAAEGGGVTQVAAPWVVVVGTMGVPESSENCNFPLD